jgi:hypothetical protein
LYTDVQVGAVTGLIGTVSGVVAMADPDTWKGMAEMALSVAKDPSSLPGVLENMGKEFVAWDKWSGDHPGRAAGEAAFNIGSLFVPGGALSKTGSVAKGRNLSRRVLEEGRLPGVRELGSWTRGTPNPIETPRVPEFSPTAPGGIPPVRPEGILGGAGPGTPGAGPAPGSGPSGGGPARTGEPPASAGRPTGSGAEGGAGPRAPVEQAERAPGVEAAPRSGAVSPNSESSESVRAPGHSIPSPASAAEPTSGGADHGYNVAHPPSADEAGRTMHADEPLTNTGESGADHERRSPTDGPMDGGSPHVEGHDSASGADPSSYHSHAPEIATSLNEAFVNGDPTSQLAGELADLSTHYIASPVGDSAAADRIVLGKWDGMDGGYIGEARHHGGIYYDTGDATWEAMSLGLDDSQVRQLGWQVNEQFLRRQLELGVSRIEYVLPAAFDSVEQLAAVQRLSFSAMEINFLKANAEAYGYVQRNNVWIHIGKAHHGG